MGYGLALKEELKYRCRPLLRYVEKARLALHADRIRGTEEISPLWSIFITYACTTDCHYCVQNYSFKNGREDSPLKGRLPPQDWLLLNNAPDRPKIIVITGGEPFLYKRLTDVLAGLSGFEEVWVVTNLALEVAGPVEKLRTIKTHRIRFHCSYHENAIDFATFLKRAIRIKQAGLLGSVRIVETDRARSLTYLRQFAMNGIKIQPLQQVGMKDNEASNLVRKPAVLCRTKLVLFAPNGDVYNCHTKLYWADVASSFGNVVTGFHIPEDYLICHDYGFCQPCQIGYMEVQTPPDLDEARRRYRVLPSNPPSQVLGSRQVIPILPR